MEFGLIAIKIPSNTPPIINNIFEDLNFKIVKANIAVIKKVVTLVSVNRTIFR